MYPSLSKISLGLGISSKYLDKIKAMTGLTLTTDVNDSRRLVECSELGLELGFSTDLGDTLILFPDYRSRVIDQMVISLEY
jgi:hypothetical protein